MERKINKRLPDGFLLMSRRLSLPRDLFPDSRKKP
jgi:hypothetical protein